MEETNKQIDDGGPAFGSFLRHGEMSINTPGLSTRDYFAAKAMQGIKANPDHCESTAIKFESLADEAYAIADAMLKARKR